MDTKQDMAGIIERLEAASWPSNELNGLILKESEPEFADTTVVNGWLVGGNHAVPTLAPPFTSSIDAALSLVPEGWIAGELQWWKCEAAPRMAWCQLESDTGDGLLATVEGRGATPAIALCIAALRARALPITPQEVSEEEVTAALDAYWIAAGVYKPEEMTPGRRSWPDREKSHMRAALQAALSLKEKKNG